MTTLRGVYPHSHDAGFYGLDESRSSRHRDPWLYLALHR